MARTKEFEYQQIIQKALDLFWLKGYHDTSIQDLVDHLGIGRGSLYNTFGNKRDLFIEVLDFYIARRNEKLLRALKTTPVKESFSKYVHDLIEEIATDVENHGCFIVNTMTELAATDGEIAVILAKSEEQFTECFHKALLIAKDNGELAVGKDPYELALFLSNTLKGLRVLSKVNKEKAELTVIAKIALETIF